jgi:hypothetical protein
MKAAPRPHAVLLAAAVLFLAANGCRRHEEPVSEPVSESSPASSFGELSALDPPAGPGSLAPNLVAGDQGPWLTWMEPLAADGHDGHRLLASRLGESGWTVPVEIASGHDLIAGWADLPALAQDPGGELFGHWMAALGGHHAFGVHTARSTDGGASWQAVGLLHDDTSSTEHGFVSYAPSATGVRAFWLDGRRMVDGGAMQLRTAVLGGEPAPAATVLDERVCECCSTDAAQTSAGAVVVYRDRDAGEVRDVSIVRATPDGWSEPRTVHEDGWQINGCPVNGPAVAADGTRVAVAWFTVVGEAARVQVAFSEDAGAGFGPAAVIDSSRPLGGVDVALDRDGRALVSWIGFVDDETAEIRLARIEPSGEIVESRVIAETTPKRSAGMPRMVRDGDRLVVAWTEHGERTRVRTGVVPLA